MKIRLQTIANLVVGISVASLIASSSALAHVVVKPAQVLTASFQTFTMGVPNEKDIPTVSLKLVLPDGLNYVSPTLKPGWKISTETTGSGESEKVKSITWTGGSVGKGFRDDFTFSAQAPEKATDLQWKAYQTYSDGTVVSWDQATESEKEGSNKGPFSVTKVVAQTPEAAELKQAQQAASDAKTAGDRSLYVAIVAVLIGLGGIYLATRKRS